MAYDRYGCIMELNDIKEKWQDIFNYKGYYRISNFGNVKSLHRKERILKYKKSKNGYCQVCLYKHHIRKMYTVHRLVATHFIDNPKNKSEVNHLDGNKLNNHMTNLEWATRLENQKHASILGLQNRCKGENHPNAKLTEKDVIEIRRLLLKKVSQRKIALIYNVSKSTINLINCNKIWNIGEPWI